MSKNYKHQQPVHQHHDASHQANTKLLRENAVLKAENTRLEVALKLMTGENKQELLDAIEYIELQKQATQWYTLDTNRPLVTGTTIIGTFTT